MQKNKLRRSLLILPLLLLAQCTPMSNTPQVSMSPPAPVEAQQAPQRPQEEQLELFNYALDLA